MSLRANGIIILIVMAIGLAMIVGSYMLYSDSKSFLEKAESTDGRVIEMITVESDEGSDTYKPVVRFTSPDGNAVEFTSRWSSYPPAYDVGETVTVLYDPSAPDDARIKGTNMYLGELILGILGLIFFVPCLLVMFFSMRRSRNQ